MKTTIGSPALVRRTKNRHRVLDEMYHGKGDGRDNADGLAKRLSLRPKLVSQILHYFAQVGVLEQRAYALMFGRTKFGKAVISLWGTYVDRTPRKIETIQYEHETAREAVARARESKKERRKAKHNHQSKKAKHRAMLQSMREKGLI